jgi:SPP1 family predicted phage head-tail adaptor
MTDAVIKLIKKTYTQNEDKALVETETVTDVFCSVRSVGRNDFYSASQLGMDLQYVFLTNPVNYNGESIVEYEGERYGVSRTYQSSADVLEIYAGTEVGAYGSDEGN